MLLKFSSLFLAPPVIEEQIARLSGGGLPQSVRRPVARVPITRLPELPPYIVPGIELTEDQKRDAERLARMGWVNLAEIDDDLLVARIAWLRRFYSGDTPHP